MQGHGHLKLAKKLNDKIPKMVDEMFERVGAFIREAKKGSEEEAVQGSSKGAWGHCKLPTPPPLIGTLKKQNLNKFCDYHGDRGHNTNDCYHLKKQIEEVVPSRKLAHLVRDIRQGNQRNRGQARGNVKSTVRRNPKQGNRMSFCNPKSPLSLPFTNQGSTRVMNL
ncbi:hypothetical protein Tco_1180455 [Tanacetum coccineum]